GRASVRQRVAVDPGDPGGRRERLEGEPAAAVLPRREEGEALGRDRRLAESARRVDDDPLRRDEARRVALERLADGGGRSLGARPACAADPAQVVERGAEL